MDLKNKLSAYGKRNITLEDLTVLLKAETYRILLKEGSDEEAEKQIRQLHPALLKNGYLSSHYKVYLEQKEIIDTLNIYLFNERIEHGYYKIMNGQMTLF